jgi:hypothetical protein
MPSFRLFFVVALLVAVAFAVPAPSRRRGLQKRSFKVPRQLNTAHPTGPNGYVAMRKVFRKYNFEIKESFMSKDGLIGIEKQSQNANKGAAGAAGAAVSNQTGTVAANPGENAALFLSPVDVGGQTLNLDFDSGSSDL